MTCITTRPIALLGLIFILTMVNHVTAKTLTFIELSLGCTNNDNGRLQIPIYLSQSCSSSGPLSSDDGCKTGTFHGYNTTNCSGDVAISMPKDTCTNITLENSITGIYRCLSYSDPEYLRTVTFVSTSGPGTDSTCQSPLTAVSFTRLGVCYPVTDAGVLGYKYEKANATAYRVTEYNDAVCNSINRTYEGNADGSSCVNSAHMDFVDANLLSNTAALVGRSTGLIAVIGILAVALTL